MMGRIDAVLRKKGTTAFIGFTVAGDPDKETSVRIAKVLIDGGTDILEFGVPFSDPVADGPTIQRADDRALAAGTTPNTIFEIVRAVRGYSDVPIVFLTYYNTIYRRGIDRFYREAHEAGVDGILVADMPVEESEEVIRIAAKYGIDPIFLITQTTSDERMDIIVRRARGYLYLVSVLGITGARKTVSPEALALLQRVRKHTSLPLALGFGISTPDHVKTCREAGADGVIVGSAIVDIVEKNLGDVLAMEKELRHYVAGMKTATGTSGIREIV
jgi:tryptophan synthase alpha chain